MKKAPCILILLICLSCLINSCQKVTEESQFNEFEINCNDGTVRSGGIYLPKGISSKDKLPVIYMADGLVFKDCNFRKMIDSLMDNNSIKPVVIACSYENKMTIPDYDLAFRNAEYVETLAKNDNKLAKLFDNHYYYFVNEFIPYIEKNAPVSTSAQDRIFFGTSNSADFGLTLSMRNQGLMAEYWCYSPVYSDVSEYGMLSVPTSYRICWGAKEEINMFDYFPALIKDIRKRGGQVHSWVFNGGHDRSWWKYWFGQELETRFPYKN
jgi:enterochelin esterase-like enzyme